MALDPVTAALNIGGKLIDKFFPDPAAKQAAQLKLMEMAQAGEFKALEADLQMALGQMEINKAEAQSGSFFVAGWRPAVGWVCVLGLAYTFIAWPILHWYSNKHGIDIPPQLELGPLITLLGGLLGLGGFRTYEKIKGVARGKLAT